MKQLKKRDFYAPYQLNDGKISLQMFLNFPKLLNSEGSGAFYFKNLKW